MIYMSENSNTTVLKEDLLVNYVVFTYGCTHKTACEIIKGALEQVKAKQVSSLDSFNNLDNYLEDKRSDSSRK